jgi:glutaconyl-CoA decarboxylase
MASRVYPLHPYFSEMPGIGQELSRVNEKNAEEIKKVEAEIAQEVERVKNNGKSTESMNEKGEWTAWQRLEYLVDPGTWCPLHTIYDPAGNKDGRGNRRN